jgi:hypothetical protein
MLQFMCGKAIIFYSEQKYGFFGDVLSKDYNLDVHIVLYCTRKSKTTSQ